MTSKWIFNDFYNNSIDPINTKYVSISPAGTVNSPLTNLIKWDETTAGCAGSVDQSLTTISFTFKNPISFSEYKIQQLANIRYMTGWKIDASFDGKTFTTIDSKEENFCTKNSIYGANVDCGEKTTRSFNIPITNAKVIRIVQTKPDIMGAFDIYGNPSNVICPNTHQTCRTSLFKYTFILLIIAFC